MRSSKLVKRGILILTILLIFLSVFLISLLVVVFFNITTEKEVDVRKTYDYQIAIRNTVTGETSLGFTSIFEDIEEDFLSYRDEDNLVLISSLGPEELREYECTGSCYCDDDERRNSGVLFANGLKYLVAAFTSALAYNIAKKQFEEECENSDLKDSCPSTSIRTFVDSCEGVIAPPEDVDADGNQFDENKDYFFLCSGHCVNMVNDEHGELFHQAAGGRFALVDLMKEFECERLRLEKEVVARNIQDAIRMFSIDKVDASDGYRLDDISTFVGFCAVQSKMFWDTMIGGDGSVHFYCRTPFFSTYDWTNGPYNNENPHCRRMRPVEDN